MAKKLTAKELGRMLYDAFDNEEWGAIDIDWFLNAADTDCKCQYCQCLREFGMSDTCPHCDHAHDTTEDSENPTRPLQVVVDNINKRIK